MPVTLGDTRAKALGSCRKSYRQVIGVKTRTVNTDILLGNRKRCSEYFSLKATINLNQLANFSKASILWRERHVIRWPTSTTLERSLATLRPFLVIQKLSQYGDHRKDIHFLQSHFCCRVPFSKIRQIYILVLMIRGMLSAYSKRKRYLLHFEFQN